MDPNDRIVLQTGRRSRDGIFEIRAAYSKADERSFWVRCKGWHDFYSVQAKFNRLVVKGREIPYSKVLAKRERYATERHLNVIRTALFHIEDGLRNKAPKEKLLTHAGSAGAAITNLIATLEAR